MNKLLSLVLIFAFVACNSSSDSSNNGDNGNGGGPNGPSAVVDKDLELVTNITQNVVSPKVESFVNYASILAGSVQAGCGGEAQKVSNLRVIWKSAMMDFHYLEAIPFGPLSDNNASLKRNLYSWPDQAAGTVVEVQIEKLNKNPEKYKFKESRMAGKGLDAFEYILFAKLNNNDVLDGASEVCPYMGLIADDLYKTSQDFKKLWQDELDYVASPDGQTSLKKYMSEITTSLYFADKNLKDRKIAAPLNIPTSLGLSCDSGVNCHEYLEHSYSLLAKEAIVQNMQALTDVITGFSQKSKTVGFGYKDYLKELGADDSVVSFSSKVGSSINSWEKLPSGEEFYESVKNYSTTDCSDGTLCSSYKALQQVTTWMKKDFISTLNTGLPGSVQGDND